MGASQSATSENSNSSTSINTQESNPSTHSLGSKLMKSFSLVSQMFSHKICLEKEPQTDENAKEKPVSEPSLVPEPQEIVDKVEKDDKRDKKS